MNRFIVKEIETTILIAWEGFSVPVWATDEHDWRGRRVWYCEADGLTYSRLTSREQAVQCGADRLRKEILAVYREFEPHSQEFLDSLNDPYVEEVVTVIHVSRGDLEVQIVASKDVEDLGEPRCWKFKDGPEMSDVTVREVAIRRAKQRIRELDLETPRCALCEDRHSFRDGCGPPF
jgi:hypothetical protein